MELRNPINRRRILIVDDNIDILMSMEMLLDLMGYIVATASNGLEAIDTARTFPPDLILMDIGMPQLNGYAVAKEIRKQSWGEKIFIVALTGLGHEQDKQDAKEAGFDFHITKPIKIDMLKRLLADLELGVIGFFHFQKSSSHSPLLRSGGSKDTCQNRTFYILNSL